MVARNRTAAAVIVSTREAEPFFRGVEPERSQLHRRRLAELARPFGESPHNMAIRNVIETSRFERSRVRPQIFVLGAWSLQGPSTKNQGVANWCPIRIV
jgi:hypothetical protein